MRLLGGPVAYAGVLEPLGLRKVRGGFGARFVGRQQATAPVAFKEIIEARALERAPHKNAPQSQPHLLPVMKVNVGKRLKPQRHLLRPHQQLGVA